MCVYIYILSGTRKLPRHLCLSFSRITSSISENYKTVIVVLHLFIEIGERCFIVFSDRIDDNLANPVSDGNSKELCRQTAMVKSSFGRRQW